MVELWPSRNENPVSVSMSLCGRRQSAMITKSAFDSIPCAWGPRSSECSLPLPVPLHGGPPSDLRVLQRERPLKERRDMSGLSTSVEYEAHHLHWLGNSSPASVLEKDLSLLKSRWGPSGGFRKCALPNAFFFVSGWRLSE